MKTLGIIGGVGPLATMYYGNMVVRLTDAKTDQEHINMIILNDTAIPDRTAFILDDTKEDPVPRLVEDAKKLEALGADVIAIPCNTAHTFYRDIQQAIGIPLIHMVRETADRAAAEGAVRVGILATTGTIRAGVYQDACRQAGLTPVVPDDSTQQLVMRVIYDQVKAGQPADEAVWNEITAAMEAQQCDRIILGCTELSIVKEELALGSRFIDALRVLSETTVIRCGAPLRNR
ncbi:MULTISPECIES: aspartate/glutamate racemase family protein [Sporosarcina]|uniref:aspartate/glutamate racemase family protein n=1 Tax=Sporosarcina TaxID=1569 RepID=UPI00058D2F48|nr:MULTISPECIES: amino acid racemase [Sporosarcina]WJY27632.1 amino acid racemase [Sporosarcina sp. 0.2-SM1T-5]